VIIADTDARARELAEQHIMVAYRVSTPAAGAIRSSTPRSPPTSTS